ncbi:hypothetical protein IFR04_014511 [Cadophora malorum]|uniref:Uncharacterized protein n=1 Tax=Cadophora malorum TaxID=108018 RepID=A0A8H7SZD3_9HELO|nr:hypothetical protein IFR04_014511 [Cadophora malorum]
MGRSAQLQLDNYRDIFGPTAPLRYLEVLNREKDSSEDCFEFGLFDVKDEAAWPWKMVSADTVKAGLRVIYTEPVEKPLSKADSRFSNQRLLAMSQSSFLNIAEHMSLPISFLRMLRDSTTVFVDVQNTSSRSQHPIQVMMIQNSFTAANRFSVALSYDTTRGLTSALVHGLTKIEISNLTRLISESRELIALPTMLFSLLLDSRVSAGNTRAEDCHSEIIEIEEQTGLRTVWNSQECSGKDQKQHQKHPLGPPRYDSLDFDDLTSKLTSISSKLAFNEYTCEVHLPMLDSFDKINRRLLEMRSAGGINSLAAVEAQLRTHNEFMRSSLTGTLFRARYLSKRAQAQIQTIYSLIAQKDNALSMRDNASLKAISEDQRRIALAATKDSAAMGVIAAITTVFLPATFTATFFSTTFFNFQPSKGESMVSGWLWLYFLITIILSVLIITWWLLVSRRKYREIQRNLGTADGLDGKVGTKAEFGTPSVQ